MKYEQRILGLSTPADLRHRLPLDFCGRVFSGIPTLVEGALRTKQMGRRKTSSAAQDAGQSCHRRSE